MREVVARSAMALVLLAGCAKSKSTVAPTTPPTPAPAKASTAAAEESPAPGLVVFDELVAEIRRHHAMAEPAFANLGRRWDDDVVELRARMAKADSPATIMRVLDELENSLLDLHLRFMPASHDPRRFMLPVQLDAEPDPAGGVAVRVSAVHDPELPIAVGDRLVALDGRPTAELLHAFRFSTSANQLRGHLDGVARALTMRSAALWPELQDKRATLTLTKDAAAAPYTVEVAWGEGGNGPPGLDEGISLELQCDGVEPRDYGPYTLAAVGARVCIYTSTDKRFARWPIVRHHSFMYEDQMGSGPRLARLDHHLVRDTLAKLGKLDGVLLDLRDNHGGNNPHVFLDWYAPAAYDNEDVVIRLDEEIAALPDHELGQILWSGQRIAEYRRRQARGDTSWTHPFLCPDAACEEGSRFTPSHRVTTAPIALLVGPWCVSSCDTLAAIYAENHFGPLVGEPTAAAYTVYRWSIPVELPDGQPLGSFTLAISRSRFGEDGAWIEGVPLPIDVPVERSWATRGDYDRRLVAAGIDALRRRVPEPRR